MECGEDLAGDRGSNIKDDLPDCFKFSIPTYLKGQVNPKDEVHTRRTASVRIHVERGIKK